LKRITVLTTYKLVPSCATMSPRLTGLLFNIGLSLETQKAIFRFQRMRNLNCFAYS